MTIYVSAAWFAKYHADMEATFDTVKQAAEELSFRAYVHMSDDASQIGMTWTDDSDVPLSVVAQLAHALDIATEKLIDADPDMISVSTRSGMRTYNLYWTYHTDTQQARLINKEALA